MPLSDTSIIPQVVGVGTAMERVPKREPTAVSMVVVSSGTFDLASLSYPYPFDSGVPVSELESQILSRQFFKKRDAILIGLAARAD